MSIKGIERRRRWKPEDAKGITNMCKIMSWTEGEKSFTVDKIIVKDKKERKKETKKRVMVEKKLELKIILALKLAGCEVAKSGEQSTYNSHYVLNGMSDLLIFVPFKGIIFMEVKQEKKRNEKNGGLRDSQVKFRSICEKYGLRYVVVYSLTEALEAIK